MFRPMINPNQDLISRLLPVRTVARTTVAAACAGLMATTALPPFRYTGLLILPALALLYGALLVSRSPGRTAWIFGLVHQAALLHWLFLLTEEAPIAERTLVPASAAAAILYVSLFYLCFGWLWGVARRRLGRDAALMLTPVLWVLMEAARGAGELGFPWCLSGSAILGTPWLVATGVAGEIALGAWASFCAVTLAAFFTSPGAGQARQASRLMLLAATAVGLAILLAATPRGDEQTARPGLRVAIVQADVDLADKWAKGKIDSTLVPYGELTAVAAARGAEFIVWAETAIPAYLNLKPQLKRWVEFQASRHGVPIFTGHPQYDIDPDGEPRKYNSSGLYTSVGTLGGRYDKHHLLPFGERMPFQGLFPWLGTIELGQAEWRPGAPPAPLDLQVDGREAPFSGLICYESIFPGLSRYAARTGAAFLVNITNDGWFGFSAGPRQHAAMARVRAAECGLPMVRCANNGISYLTDHTGAVLASAGLGERTVVEATIMPRRADTPFVRFGSWPLVVMLSAWSVHVLIMVGRRRARG